MRTIVFIPLCLELVEHLFVFNRNLKGERIPDKFRLNLMLFLDFSQDGTGRDKTSSLVKELKISEGS